MSLFLKGWNQKTSTRNTQGMINITFSYIHLAQLYQWNWKKNGEWRFYVDYQAINKAIISYKFSITIRKELFDAL